MNQTQERKPFDLRTESKAYAIESIKLYQHLTEYAPKKEYNLSKHYLLAATRIGDFIRQEAHLDACHAASSAKYWLELLYNGGYIDGDQANAMLNYVDPLVRILYVISHPESRKDKEATIGQASAPIASTAAPQVSSCFPTGASTTGSAAAPQVSSGFPAGASATNPFAKKGGEL